VQKMLTVLTDQQRSKWQELTGKPYNGPLMIPRRSGPPGPGQGPGYGRPGQPDNRPGFGPPGSPNRFNPGPPGDRGPEGAPRPRPKSNGNNPPDDRQ